MENSKVIKNANSLRQRIKNKSKETGLNHQVIMQNYMIERFLERISVSKYKRHFIIKGGTLLSSIMGLANRATMDLDATLKGLKLDEEQLQQKLKQQQELEQLQQKKQRLENSAKASEERTESQRKELADVNQKIQELEQKNELTNFFENKLNELDDFVQKNLLNLF
ncbi:hypothetical protein FACS189465_0860 [Clostridia bacterium]|nr:hypothetical protein FACS189465_0860 [Clostridia bacterium]